MALLLLVFRVSSVFSKILYNQTKPQVSSLLTFPVVYEDFPGGSDGKESDCNAEDACSIPRSGRSPGDGNGNPL